jgi:nitrogen regulatory protein P-II 1
MMFMVLFVLHDSDLMEDIVSAWEEAGVSGITILPSTGLARLRHNDALRDDLPLFPSLEDISQHVGRLNRTLFTIVDNEEQADRVIESTQRLTGDLDLPNTGILVVLPVARAYGLHRRGEKVI